MQRIDTTHINLFTTRLCNNKCWYCIEGCDQSGDLYSHIKRDHMSMDTFHNVVEFIKAQGNRHVNFHFYGGEALLHPEIWNMTEILRSEFDSIKFKLSTNLCHTFDVVGKIPNDFNVMASLHSMYVHDYMDWYANAKWIESNCNLLEVALMTQKNNIGEMVILYELWEGLLPVTIYPVDQFRPQLTDDIISKMVRAGIVFHNEDNCGTNGCMCSAGWDIDEYGNVTKCSAHKNVLLNVNKNITKLPQWGICPDASNCPCDIEFEKRSIR